ncbi:DUF1127 domain-containing protein [Phreatobacter sp.]|uniref:DUF1127 domain-containing protein n=1 Tax=Phreatobacter sp. TaxID=1966341 RepID=UPI0022CAAEC2|nr:DUF1127 domain-containing protein [Phreatobacter sp.]MCZ8315418.1 DUF1127 domain-containing protein [Phreatobacter sp.]
MSYVATSASKPTSTLSLLADRIATGFTNLLREIRARHASNELRDLNPALLKDMGISRSDIDRVVRLGR